MAEKKQTYLGVLATVFSEARAWRYTAFVLGAISLMLAYGLVTASRNATVILLPYEQATTDERGRVAIDLANPLSTQNPEYLTNLALADAALVLNFTPENVEAQYKRFLMRLTEQAYTDQNVTLAEQAQAHRRGARTQSFYPTQTKVHADGKVELIGTLIVHVGDKEVFKKRQTIEVVYRQTKGYLHVHAFNIAQ